MPFITIETEIDGSDVIDRDLETFQDELDEILFVAALAGQIFLEEYHTAFIPRWRGPPAPWQGEPGRSRFGEDIARAWQSPQREGLNEIVVTNVNPYLSHKVTGGTIRAKRTQYLTIPMDPLAAGKTAETLEQLIGPMFFVETSQGNLVLAQSLSGVSGFEDDDIQVFYLLKKSVDQQPWEGALPPDDDVADVGLSAYVNEIDRRLRANLGIDT